MKTRLLLLTFLIGLSACSSGTASDPGPAPVITASPTFAHQDVSPSLENVHVFFDDDGSRDGTAALLYLLSQPYISMEGISISYGEAHPQLYIQYIGRILDYLGTGDIPLGAGSDALPAGGTPFPDWLRQMSDSFWDYPLPGWEKTYPTRDAAELMVSVLNASTAPVTIFQSGTFTTLAQALHLDPGIMEKIKVVYFMGGAVYVPGNITNLLPESANLVAEWNILADPVAAQEVFSSGLKLYMIPLDATHAVIHTRQEILPWFDGSEEAVLVAGLYDGMITNFGFDSVEIFDLVAAVLMVNPDLCPFQPLHMQVLTAAGDTTGQTVVLPDGEANIQACLDPDVIGIKQELDEIFSH